MYLTNKYIDTNAMMVVETDTKKYVLGFGNLCFFNKDKVLITSSNDWSRETIKPTDIGEVMTKRKLSLSAKEPYFLHDKTMNLMIPCGFLTLEDFRYEVQIYESDAVLDVKAVRLAYVRELETTITEIVGILDLPLIDYRRNMAALIKDINKCLYNLNLDKAQNLLDEAKELKKNRGLMMQKLRNYTLNDFFAACNNKRAEEGFVYLSPDIKVTKEKYDKMDPKKIEKIWMEIPDEKLRNWSLIL